MRFWYVSHMHTSIQYYPMLTYQALFNRLDFDVSGKGFDSNLTQMINE